jgi:hypothetical protein
MMVPIRKGSPMPDLLAKLVPGCPERLVQHMW